jgi:hypothetical protein
MLRGFQISAVKREHDGQSVSESQSKQDSDKIFQDEVSDINVNCSPFDNPDDSDEIDFMVNVASTKKPI